MATYGHCHLGFTFRRLLEVKPDGFIYRGKHYQWDGINKIKRYDSPSWNLLFYQVGTPLAYVYLKDGKRICIRGRVLQKEGEKSEVGFIRGATKAYDELLNLLEKKWKANNP